MSKIVCTMTTLAGGVLVAAMAGCAARPVYTVSCGADQAYTDAGGKQWLADQEKAEGTDWGALDGSTITREPVAIPGTEAPQVYLTERYGMTGYEFKLDDGAYTVRLHFAETYDGILDAGERVFDVSLNDKVVLKDLDVFKAAGGPNTPLVKEFKGVKVTGGKLVIGFAAAVQNSEINGIEILAE